MLTKTQRVTKLTKLPNSESTDKNTCLTLNNLIQFLQMIVILSIVPYSIYWEDELGLNLTEPVKHSLQARGIA